MNLEKEAKTSHKNICVTIIIGYDAAPDSPDTPMVIKPVSGRQRCESRRCRLHAMVATVFVSGEIRSQTKPQNKVIVKEAADSPDLGSHSTTTNGAGIPLIEPRDGPIEVGCYAPPVFDTHRSAVLRFGAVEHSLTGVQNDLIIRRSRILWRRPGGRPGCRQGLKLIAYSESR